MTQQLTKQWQAEQFELRKQLITQDVPPFTSRDYEPNLIGGVDISYFNDDTSRAYVTLVVLRREQKSKWELAYEHSTFISNITTPYIPSYLAFREVEHLAREVDILRETRPDLLPEVLLVDGNGLLHPRQFGSACHLGLITDMVTIGVAKNPYLFLDHLDKQQVRQIAKDRANSLKKRGDFFEIENDGQVVGVGLKTGASSKNPVYVSIGHKMSLETAIRVVLSNSSFRIPEAIRQADMISRSHIRDHMS